MFETLGNLGDFIGGIGVVITLLYLAIQIKRNTEQTRLNTAGDSWSGILEAFEPFYYGENSAIFQRGLAGDSELTEGEFLTFAFLMTRMLGQFELSLYQNRHGALDEELLAMQSRIIQSIVITPGGRQWWERAGQNLFGGAFVAYVAEILGRPDARLPDLSDPRPPQPSGGALS